MRLQNYYISDEKSNPVAKGESDKLFLVGRVFGRGGVPDGSVIHTSAIASLYEKRAVTSSGSVYDLDDICPDYTEFLDAKAKGIEIVSEWNLTLDSNIMMDVPSLKDPDALKKITDPDNLHTGYMLQGKLANGSTVYGEVVGQTGNYVTLRVSSFSNGDALMEEKKYFVNWRSLSLDAEFAVRFGGGEIAGLSYEQWFEEAFNLQCRPKMF